jgi:molybdopterin-guanine dinucleotide biosynthesis protein B
VLVEGWKHADLPKIEVWRAALGQAPLYPHDPFVTAVATDDRAALPAPTGLPVIDLAKPGTLVALLLESAARYQRAPAGA